jgi:lipopolysaccharide export LptBFGC system permease protein LptF
MNTLDRYVATTAFTRWAMVLFIGVFLIVLGDFIANMGIYLRAVHKHHLDFLAEYFIYRFPEFMAIWLPLSAAAAGLLTAAPMLRQGTLIALLAAGVAPWRVFASLLVLAVLIGGLGLVLKDQVIPRVAPEAKMARDRMEEKLGREEERPRAVGWHDGEHFWSSQAALPDAGVYHNVAVFGAQGSHHASSMLIADSLSWKDGHWLLANAALVGDESQPYKVLALCQVEEVGLTLSGDPEQLAGRLKLDTHKTSDELLSANASFAWAMIAMRITFGLLPLLCLLAAMPGFIRLEGRSGIGTMVGKALLMTGVPLGVFWLLSRLLVANGTNALPSCVVGVGTLLAVGLWRWFRMRM